jgi:putative heme-binding domain-containing protein
LAQGERGRLGPDLSGLNNKTREELLAHVLDPSFEIQSNYTNYVIVDKQGRIYDGLLAAETAEAVTLRGEYENVSLRRGEIEEMRASKVSLMPEGLEENMSRQDLADVIAYLRAGL